MTYKIFFFIFLPVILLLSGAGCQKQKAEQKQPMGNVNQPAAVIANEPAVNQPEIKTEEPSPAVSLPQDKSVQPAVITTPVLSDAAVAIKNFSFQPAEITIPAGTTVVWTQFDSVRHNINADGLFQSPLLDENDTYKYKFDKAGTFDYYCGPHPFMKGKIIVK